MWRPKKVAVGGGGDGAVTSNEEQATGGSPQQQAVPESSSSNILISSSGSRAVEPPTAGAYQLCVHVLEGRKLGSRDADGMSDPMVTIKLLSTGEQQSTEIRSNTLDPVFESTFLYELSIDSPGELFAASVLVEAVDSDPLSADELIGAYQLGLGQIWRTSPEHRIYRRWFAISDTTGTFEGVQGYLLLSFTLVPEGAPMPPEPTDHPTDDALTNPMLSPAIEMESRELRLRVFQASDLPELDSGLLGGGSCDPFVEVEFGTRSARTATQKASTHPTFNEELRLPVVLPAAVAGAGADCGGLENLVLVRAKDWDMASTDDVIGTAAIPLSTIENARELCHVV